ncbi:hypothetical protein [Oceanobacillus sp. ISL-73]|uniref:hypothetical protein n=1 Tax=Oceanobacillus sp. ISL-73 TaxID=2819161 RepID=UPI001BE8FDB8|nr:hypothetical protein [Oceanobacillus sp. ISL-73]MBT2652755.1 hypothetical protein [Oceanobacillus sp. ISL-73]
MFSFILLIGCSGEAKENTEEDYEKIAGEVVQYYLNNVSTPEWELKQKYGDDIRETSTIKIYDGGRYVHVETPYLNRDDGAFINNYFEYEDGEVIFRYKEDFEKAIGDKEPVYVEKEGEVKQ